jgi:hypothetical protein
MSSFGAAFCIGAGGSTVNQTQLQLMAEERIIDAGALLVARRWAYAYYVAGYATECALKSCVLSRMIHTGGVFTDKKFAEWCWTHDFERLVELSGLIAEHDAQIAASPAFLGHWGTTILWDETSRYKQKGQQEAEQLYEAITNNSDGVMPWIRKYW